MGRWEDASRVLIDGPGGCIQVRGSVDMTLAIYRPGGWMGPGETTKIPAKGSFEGTLKDGAWTRLVTDFQERAETGGKADEFEFDRFHPVIGRITPQTDRGEPPEEPEESDGDEVSISIGGDGTQVAVDQGSSEAMNILDEIMDQVESDVNLSYSGWDASTESVVLHQVVPMEERGDAIYQVVTLFPNGGPPTRLDAVFPKRWRMPIDDSPVKVTLMNGQLHIRGTATELGVIPTEEGASIVAGVLGFTFGFDQHIRYTSVRQCPDEAGDLEQ